MGGFELYGPTLKITKINECFCFCFGYVGLIDQKTEDYLKQLSSKQISKTKFIELINPQYDYHIGDELIFNYKLSPRNYKEESKDLYFQEILETHYKTYTT